MPPITMPLIDQILAVTGDYKAQQLPDGTLFPNVQNHGLPKGACAVRHKKGDYHQFAVRAEQDIPPLLTHRRVAEAVRSVNAGDLAGAAGWLTVEREFAEEGAGVVHAALCLWLDQNDIPAPEDHRAKATSLTAELQQRLLLKRTDPMPFALSIAALGCAGDTGTSVVPEEWLGRRFECGRELCRAIDTLPHRQGLPEARYCCHYGLKLVAEPQWLSAEQIGTEFLSACAISVLFENGILSTSIQRLNAGTLRAWVDSQPERARFLRHDAEPGGDGDPEQTSCILIACDRDAVCEPVPIHQKTHSVGLLCSRLQKAIRRGRGAAGTLVTTIEQLRAAPAYHLPDDHFKRSSGSRQLAWRLFISLFEDAEPYAPAPDGDYLSLPDLVALSILAHCEPELQFNRLVTGKLIRTALLVQRNDAHGKNWDWRKGGKGTAINGDTVLEMVCAAALDFMPMMKRDAEMLRQGCEHLRKSHYQLAPLPNSWSNEELLRASDAAVEKAALTASHDFHCNPAILLHLQASTPLSARPGPIPQQLNMPGMARSMASRRGKKSKADAGPPLPTTQNLKRFIWENVSRINTRNPHHRPATDAASQALLREIHAIQRWLLDREPAEIPPRDAYGARDSHSAPSGPVDPMVARTAFLSLFGQAMEVPAAGADGTRRLKHPFIAILAGSADEPCKVKKKGGGQAAFLKGEDRRSGERDLVHHLAATDGMEVEMPPPPAGHRWTFTVPRGKVRIRVTENILYPAEGDALEQAASPLLFHVEDIPVPAFDARCLLERRSESLPVCPNSVDARLIRRALYLESPEPGGHWETNQQLRLLAARRREAGEPDLEWMDIAARSPMDAVVWQRVSTKLLGTFRGRVTIGPVDRHGDKLYAAVDYLHEGTLWRVFNLLAFLYPRCVQPCGELDFSIHTESASHARMSRELERLAAPRAQSSGESIPPTITTPLWQHQSSSVDRITAELLRTGRKGFGDASDVGSGKTLSSLAILCNLARHNLDTGDATAEGFLVLVYNAALVQTWRDEIGKHTVGFHFVTQDSAGALSEPIRRHSILVTTLNRMRDTPVTRRWHMVVIDECLSVQNSSALWTQEAWNQVACSQRGVLLLSATFFRSRFNELFYLLRMLRTGLPESRPYLDAILSECITCHLPKNTPWKWTEQTRLLPLDEDTRKRYEQIRRSSGQPKMLYGKLDSLLVESFDFALHVGSLLDELVPRKRALIFARSKEEARKIAEGRRDVSVFPDTTQTHIVTTTAMGARGVNTLTCCNVLITRPVEPDLVPQMKGRLARPGQQDGELEWIWMVIEHTIEQAKLERNRMAEAFHGEHILPLASFYQRALEA